SQFVGAGDGAAGGFVGVGDGAAGAGASDFTSSDFAAEDRIATATATAASPASTRAPASRARPRNPARLRDVAWRGGIGVVPEGAWRSANWAARISATSAAD